MIEGRVKLYNMAWSKIENIFVNPKKNNLLSVKDMNDMHDQDAFIWKLE
jgi:hypothetical protein